MSQKDEPLTWKTALLNTPGPLTKMGAFVLFLKGIFVGIANIIPGVSGGTVALITGIYTDLLLAIKSFNLTTIRLLLTLQVKRSINTIHFRFLIPLGLGLAISVLSVAQIITYVFDNYQVYTWSLFFGLILASIVVMGLQTKNWLGVGGIGFLLGAVAAYFLVGMIPVNTPDSWWFIIIAGVFAIITMILPGLSGSFLLLILGKYEYVISALKNPFNSESLFVIMLFGVGCVGGIMAFSRVMSMLLAKYENATMAVLTGIMCGCMRKIWPWKEVLETKEIQGEVKILSEANILPGQLDTSLIIAVGLMVVGFALVILLEKSVKKD